MRYEQSETSFNLTCPHCDQRYMATSEPRDQGCEVLIKCQSCDTHFKVTTEVFTVFHGVEMS